VFVGHGIMTDLKVMGLGESLQYVDTAWFEERDLEAWVKKANPKKLSALVKEHLNGVI
jgi:hypothetical protein